MGPYLLYILKWKDKTFKLYFFWFKMAISGYTKWFFGKNENSFTELTVYH